MLAALFTFSGRIGRAQFIRWSVLQGIVSLLLLTGYNSVSSEAIARLETGTAESAGPSIGIALLLGLALVLLPSSALLVKRLRDVGLPAWPCFGVISGVDALLTAVVPHGPGFTEGPFAGLAFTTLVTVLLALVPGRSETAAIDDAPSDWVDRAIEVEGKLIADRRRQSVPTSAVLALGQLESIEALRRKANVPRHTVVEQGFGRRRSDRR